MQQTCQKCKTNFEIPPEDQAFYEKIDVPPPTFCWLCRTQRRFVFRCERKLFKRTSTLSGDPIFSMYRPEDTFPVYTRDEWFSDAWDPMDYGRDYDFDRPFFEQFLELSREVPRPARAAWNLENSDYTNNAADLKNCYLIFNANENENCMYGNAIGYSRDCVDCSHVDSSEMCYESFWLTRCSKVFYSSQCEDSNEVWFSKNLRGCNNCFGCVNLRNSSYQIFNEQYTKEEYWKKLEEMDVSSFDSLTKWKKKAHEFWLEFPNKYYEGSKNDDVSGEYIFNSKNTKYSFLIRDAKDVKYSQYLQFPSSEDSYDISSYGLNTTGCYEGSVIGSGVNNLKFCFECYNDVRDCEYSGYCEGSSNLFGCFGLRKKQYCIFNKQYTKEEYFDMVAKIKKQMKELPFIDAKGLEYRYGEFFPAEQSPFSYENTIAIEHFPLTKDEVIAQGFTWHEQEPNQYQMTIEAKDLPQTITETEDSILQEVIKCPQSGRMFRITEAELQFYRQTKLPVPHLHPDERHNERIKMRNTVKLYERETEDGKTVLTAYAPDRPEKILSEEAYNREVN